MFLVFNKQYRQESNLISDLVKKDDGIKIVAGVDMAGKCSCDYPVFESIADCDVEADVIIDFSTPGGSFSSLDYAVCHLVPVVIATTGFDDEQNSKILEYSEAIPIFKASNMSYVINLMKTRNDITIDVIAFDVHDIEANNQLRCTALMTSGKFLNANSQEDLSNSLFETVGISKDVKGSIKIPQGF